MDQDNKIAVRQEKKTAVMIRSEMLQNPKIMESLQPVERSIFLASTAKTIAEYSPVELAADLENSLKWICKDVGYRSTDEGERKYLVIRTTEILKRYYPNLTLKDFRMAFEMSITGELDDYLPKMSNGQPDKGHYQQFNAEYICKILNAYRGRRAGVMKKAYEGIQDKEPEPDPKRIEYYLNIARKNCIEAYEYYRQNGRLPEMTSIAEMYCYEMLSAAGLADEIVVTAEEQKVIWQRTVNEFARRGLIGDVHRMETEGIAAKDIEHGSFVLARRKALAATFRRMAEQGININDYIKIENGTED